MFVDIYKGAKSPKALRGLATNVANYNAWEYGGSGGCPGYATDENGRMDATRAFCDERKYIHLLADKFRGKSFPVSFSVQVKAGRLNC